MPMNALLKIYPQAKKKVYDHSYESLFTRYNSLTAKEYSELSGIPRIEVEKLLNQLVTDGKLNKLSTKNGAMWSSK